MRGIVGARGLPVLKGAHSMTMGGERLMGRVGVVLADLVVPRSLAMKLRSLSMMLCRGCMVPCCPLACGHGLSLP